LTIPAGSRDHAVKADTDSCTSTRFDTDDALER
jgi:hypothetical protein